MIREEIEGVGYNYCSYEDMATRSAKALSACSLARCSVLHAKARLNTQADLDPLRDGPSVMTSSLASKSVHLTLCRGREQASSTRSLA